MKRILLLAVSTFTIGLANAQLLDGGFEDGPGGPWTEASSTFGTPICDVATCGNGGGPCVPNTGTFYVWFGGANSIETGSVEQALVFPTGTTGDLTMAVKIASPGAGLLDDRIEVSIDGTIAGTITSHDSTTYTDYTPYTLDVSSYADGLSHTIRIEGFQTTTAGVNILVDDVVLAIDGVTIGLFEFEEEVSSFSVYPNPANEEFNLNFGSLKGATNVSIFSLDGAIISEHEVNDVFGKTLSFNTTNLMNGVYILQVENNGTISTERVVIAR